MLGKATAANDCPHKPVLLNEFLAAVRPVTGVWIDCTYGAGGYATALTDAGAGMVVAIDCDPDAVRSGRRREQALGGKLKIVQGKFGDFESFSEVSSAVPVQGVVMDLGVSSMQFDQADRGFSLQRDGPLDMRMAKTGRSASDIINTESENCLSEIFFKYGEERASRRIARRIVSARSRARITCTGELAAIVESCVPRRSTSRTHPATKIFQALRIAVNNELEQLVHGLEAAERSLRVGGRLAVVSFHSLEDRIVKRFINGGPSAMQSGRHAPPLPTRAARFRPITKRAVRPSSAELAANPRSRSARLRVAARTDSKPISMDPRQLGLPQIGALGRR